MKPTKLHRDESTQDRKDIWEFVERAARSCSTNPPDPFGSWLLEYYGYEPDGTPSGDTPMFVTPDGTFDLASHSAWIEERRKEYLRTLTS